MSNLSQAVERWQEHCNNIQQLTTVNKSESPAEKQKRRKRAENDYAFFVEYYFPHFAKSKCGDFHLAAANKVKKEKNIIAVWEWARAHAKSVHFDIIIPLWLKIQQPREINVMVLVSKSEDMAITLLGDIQAELQFNQRYINDYGNQISFGDWKDGEFVTTDGTAFFARGRGQSPRGLRYKQFRPDYVIMDDLDDDTLVENESRVRKMIDWVKEALYGTLDGGRGRFMMVGNRIHKNSVLANIAKAENIVHNQVNILDKNGNPTWHQKYTLEEIARMEQFQGYRSFQKEYMNNPITEGAVFKNNWIQYKKMLPLNKYEEQVIYIDPSFKSSTKNDYKAAKHWAKTGNEFHCIKAFVRQCTVTELVRWCYDYYEKIRDKAAITFYMEANFMQDMILDAFDEEGKKRGFLLPIRADKRAKPDKFQRIESISPFWERGFVYYNIEEEKDKDMISGLEQTLAFEKGSSAHDDGPDADEGAIYILQTKARTSNFQPAFGQRKHKNLW